MAATVALGLTTWHNFSAATMLRQVGEKARAEARAAADAGPVAGLAPLAVEFRQQFETARGELLRQRGIIDHAIAALVPGFSRMHKQTAPQGNWRSPLPAALARYRQAEFRDLSRFA